MGIVKTVDQIGTWAFAAFWAAMLPFLLPLSYSTKLLHSALQYLLVFCLLMPVFFLLARLAVKRVVLGAEPNSDGNRWVMVITFLLCFATWGAYWILFYPGFISWDFYVQWHQMAGRIPYSDWHPVFHTLTLWLVTRIWYSPAMVSLVQIASLAVLVAMIMGRLYRRGAPWWGVTGVTAFYALSPLIGCYSVSLWKDIAYSIAFLWLTVLLIILVLEKGKALSRRPFVVALWIAMFAVASLRHNGVVPAFGTLMVLTILYYAFYGRILLILWIVLVSSIMLFKGPGFRVFQVDVTEKNVLKAHLPIQHIGAILQDERNTWREGDEAFLERIMPLSRWREAFDPRSCMPLIFGKDEHGKPYLNGELLKNPVEYQKFLSIWRRAIVNHPLAIAKYHLTGGETLWKVYVPYSVFVVADEDLLEEHLFSGYRPSTALSSRVGPIGKFLLAMVNDGKTGWFIHRGALYFWLGLFCLCLLALRCHPSVAIVLAAPFLLQALTVIAFPLVQDTRFMFPIILVTPLYPLLLFCLFPVSTEITAGYRLEASMGKTR